MVDEKNGMVVDQGTMVDAVEVGGEVESEEAKADHETMKGDDLIREVHGTDQDRLVATLKAAVKVEDATRIHGVAIILEIAVVVVDRAKTTLPLRNRTSTIDRHHIVIR